MLLGCVGQICINWAPSEISPLSVTLKVLTSLDQSYKTIQKFLVFASLVCYQAWHFGEMKSVSGLYQCVKLPWGLRKTHPCLTPLTPTLSEVFLQGEGSDITQPLCCSTEANAHLEGGWVKCWTYTVLPQTQTRHQKKWL